MTTTNLEIGSFSELQPSPMDGLKAAESRLKKRTHAVVAQRRDESHNTCHCCGFHSSLEIHHIQPLCFGGEDELWNTIALCRLCHKYSPNDAKDFLDYQRMGGQLPLHVISTCTEIIDQLKSLEVADDYLHVVRQQKEDIEAAVQKADIKRLQELMLPYLSRQKFGVCDLSECVGKVQNSADVEHWRAENMRRQKAQTKKIKTFILWLHPELPIPPKSLVKGLWDNEEAVCDWLLSWEDVLEDVRVIRRNGIVSNEVFSHYRNAWLGAESMIDFLDMKDHYFLEAAGVKKHPDCLLQSNREEAGK